MPYDGVWQGNRQACFTLCENVAPYKDIISRFIRYYLFNEVLLLINKDGLIIIVEPGILSAKEFNETINIVKKWI